MPLKATLTTVARGSGIASCLTMQIQLSRITAAALCLMVMTMTSLVAGQGRGNSGNKGRPAPAPTAPAHTRVASSGPSISASISFGSQHVHVMRDYYGPRFRALPPGLQKKYARTGQLPPGWQKKMEPLPVHLERDMPRLPDGYRRGVIDGHAVIYSSRAGTIVDVAVLF